MGIRAAPMPGLSEDEFVREMTAAHVRGELKGRLRAIRPEYRGG